MPHLLPPYRASLLAALVVALLLAGCATVGPSPLERLHQQPAVEYRGHFTVGGEGGGSWFVPCGGSAANAWWVTVLDTAAAQIGRARASGQVVAGRPSYVQWRGVRTEGGEVGPPGRTALPVRTVAVVRPAAAGDCDGG